VDEEYFPIAPMSGDLRASTAVLLVLPVALVGIAFLAGGAAHAGLLTAAAILPATYLVTWLGLRPSRFELSTATLRIVWPVRATETLVIDIASVRLLARSEFCAEYGQGMRIGAGGLWGGFGLLLTRKGLLSMYVTRTDRYVLVERSGTRPLLITPADPERFVAAVSRLGRRPEPTAAP